MEYRVKFHSVFKVKVKKTEKNLKFHEKLCDRLSCKKHSFSCLSYMISERDIRIFTIMEEIKADSREIRQQLQGIRSLLTKSGRVIEFDCPDGFTFPLKSDSDVEDVEIKLRNKEIVDALVSLSSVTQNFQNVL